MIALSLMFVALAVVMIVLLLMIVDYLDRLVAANRHVDADLSDVEDRLEALERARGEINA